MFEYHGWATLRETYLNKDNFDEKIDLMINLIKAKIDELGADNGLLDLRTVNGEYQLHLSGLLNHKSQRADDLLGLYEFIAKSAMGSYGILYVHDDENGEGQENEFQVFVMARGNITKNKDVFLSPFIPTVEDALE